MDSPYEFSSESLFPSLNYETIANWGNIFRVARNDSDESRTALEEASYSGLQQQNDLTNYKESAEVSSVNETGVSSLQAESHIHNPLTQGSNLVTWHNAITNPQESNENHFNRVDTVMAQQQRRYEYQEHAVDTEREQRTTSTLLNHLNIPTTHSGSIGYYNLGVPYPSEHVVISEPESQSMTVEPQDYYSRVVNHYSSSRISSRTNASASSHPYYINNLEQRNPMLNGNGSMQNSIHRNKVYQSSIWNSAIPRTNTLQLPEMPMSNPPLIQTRSHLWSQNDSNPPARRSQVIDSNFVGAGTSARAYSYDTPLEQVESPTTQSTNESSSAPSVFVPSSYSRDILECDTSQLGCSTICNDDVKGHGPAFVTAMKVAVAHQLLIQASASASVVGTSEMSQFSKSLSRRAQHLNSLMEKSCPKFLIGKRELMKTSLALVSSVNTRESSSSPIPTCSICLDKLVSTVLLPCRHLFCEVCAPQIKTCGVCRKTIKERHKIYL